MLCSFYDSDRILVTKKVYCCRFLKFSEENSVHFFKIVCYRSSRLRGGGREGGGQLRFGKMRSYLQWEYCVRASRRQNSLHQCVQKEIRCTDFWLFMDGKQVMSLIQYTVLTFLLDRD